MFEDILDEEEVLKKVEAEVITGEAEDCNKEEKDCCAAGGCNGCNCHN